MKTVPAAMTGLYVLLYILPLGMRPFCIPDETRYGEIPRKINAREINDCFRRRGGPPSEWGPII
ncbi:MAG: hypothetical protein DRH37_08070 [Deltaproteobacteria bacterium]|nr:MAG: hypothetical protein DRH37_08070 [Deltaproteobacteria bacterium]